MGKKLNLLGQRFNYLTVLEEVPERSKEKLVQWKCQCDCGNIVTVPGAYLKSGRRKSCGCQKNIGIIEYNEKMSKQAAIPINTRFGKLIVIEDLGFKPQYSGAEKNRRWYKCKCDCGNIIEVNGNLLKSGQKVSCGCIVSKGEMMVEQLLKENNCIYNHDVVLQEFLKETGYRYRFDFIVYNNDSSIKYIVEVDGRQHYDGPDTNYWGKNPQTLEEIKKHDLLKNKFCKEHNYRLLRIPYWRIKNLKYEELERGIFDVYS